MLASSDFFLQRILRKLKKGLELVSKSHFSYNFLIKNYLVMLHKLAKFYYQPEFTCQVIQCVSWFMARYLMTSWHLNIWKFKILRRKRPFKVNKNIWVCLFWVCLLMCLLFNSYKPIVAFYIKISHLICSMQFK